MTLEEWAQSLHIGSDPIAAEFACEILEYIDQESEFERLRELEADIQYETVRYKLKDMKSDKILEWLSAQAELVEECQRRLKKHGFEGQDLDDQVEQLAETVYNIEHTLETMGGYEIDENTDLDLLVIDLCQRAKPAQQYDL